MPYIMENRKCSKPPISMGSPSQNMGEPTQGAGRVIINGYNMMEHDTTMGTRPISWDGPNKTIENGDMAGDSDDCGMTCCFTQVRQWISSPYNWTNPTH